MNRNDLRDLSRTRLAEAKLLLDSGHYAGAYYLVGYVVECALKACIAKKTKRYEFPDKKRVEDSWNHDLTRLTHTAGLQPSLDLEMKGDPKFWSNWGIVKEWKETSRYDSIGEREARDLFTAVSDRRHGVLRWLRRYW